MPKAPLTDSWGDSHEARFLTPLAGEIRAMPSAVRLREDYSAEELRTHARRSKDVSQSRRLLSLAGVRDGMERAAAKIGVGKWMILDISTTEVRKPRVLRGIVDPPEAVVCDRFHQMGVAQAPPAPRVDSATASSSRRVNISGSCGKPALIHSAWKARSARPTGRPVATPRASRSAPLIGSLGSGVSGRNRPAAAKGASEGDASDPAW